MIGQVVAELAAAITPGHKVQRLAGGGVQGGGQSTFAWHGDRCGGQALAGVRVPGVVGLQIDAAQIAIETLEHAVDHGRVGLQGHVDAQAVDEHAGNHGSVVHPSGFFLDNAGQNQRFFCVFEGQAEVPLRPGRGQLTIHGLCCPLQQV